MDFLIMKSPLSDSYYLIYTQSPHQSISGWISSAFSTQSERKYYLFFLITTLVVYILYAIGSSMVVDFIALNGKFQNYNVVRRLLEGQKPYVDFVPYLGMGHMWLTSIFTKILGGTFGANVLACNIITALICPITVFGLSRCYLKYNGLIPFTLCMFIVGLDIFKTQSGHYLFFNILDTGLSARGIRGMILPLSLILSKMWINLVQILFAKSNRITIITLIGLSFIAGFSFCWSNDYGPCVLIAIIIMATTITFARKRSILNVIFAFGTIVVGSFLSILTTALLLSKGQLNAWLSNNFAFGEYQKWYFMIPSDKIYYLYQLDFSIYVCCAIGLFGYYFVQLIREHASNYAIIRFGIPGFCLLTSVGAAQEYHLFGGGGRELNEILCLVLYTTIMLESTLRLFHLTEHNSKSIVVQISTSIIIIVITFGILAPVQKIYENYIYPKNSAKYISSLGGHFKYRYRDLSRTTEFLTLHPGQLFSTYATAAEVITGQFQPSGIDYIIHALSDKSRAEYINSLKSSNPRYVTTIRESYSTGRWNRNANWFFHRIIYRNYHIVFRNSYQFFWKKNNHKENILQKGGIQVDVQVIDNHQTRITIFAPKINNGIADVKIDYSTTVHSNLRSYFIIYPVVGIFQNNSEDKCLEYIQPDGRCDLVKVDAWSLRPNSSEYIPVEIHDGVGTVLLRSYPEDNTSLHLNSAHCTEILTPSEVLMMQPVDDEFKSNE